MGRSRKGKCVRKNTQLDIDEPDAIVKAPHSFVIHRGLPGEQIIELTKDFRKIMEPYTATSLKERKKNSIKDFASVAGVLHVTHLSIFSKTNMGIYLKLCRFPRGPTLNFKVLNFSLARDIISTLKKQMVFEEIFKHSPLVIMNNFTGVGLHIKLMASTFQNMFPTINLTTVDLNTIRRCICFNYNAATKSIDVRHYVIRVVPLGLSKGVKKLVEARVPNLSNCDNYSDFLTKATISESEGEDDPSNCVTLSQKLSSRGNYEKNNSAIRLHEIGPRLTLQLIKIEDGLLDGNVLYHELIHKTDEEKLEIEKKRQQKTRLKEIRKKTQAENKKLKEKKKEDLKTKSLAGMKAKGMATDFVPNKKNENYQSGENKEKIRDDNEDDSQYYREEVGQEPDNELFQKTFKRSKSFRPRQHKRLKTSH